MSMTHKHVCRNGSTQVCSSVSVSHCYAERAIVCVFVLLRQILYREALFTCVLLYVVWQYLCNSKQMGKPHWSKSSAGLTDERYDLLTRSIRDTLQ